MNRYQKLIVLSAVSVSFVFDVFAQDAKVWSLKECLDYALENNITIKKDKLSESTAETDLKKAKAALQPSLSASVTQSLNYRPFQESAGNFVNGTMTSSTSNKTTESGSYGINARWSVWDGGVNRNTIKLRQGELNIARLQTSVEANSIQEKIMQYYVQILYSKEAVNVNKNIFAKGGKRLPPE